MATLVTGCNRGIGLELAKQLKQKGHKVIGLCRTYSDDIRLVADQVIDGIDLTDTASLQKAVMHIKEPLQLVIHNAGIFLDDEIDKFDKKSLMQQYLVNTIAPLEFTTFLLPKLANGAKLAFISSKMGSITDNHSGSYYGYRMSKAALNAGVKTLSVDLRPRNIVVGAFHPGYVQTRMTNFKGEISPEQSARGLIQQIEKLSGANSGTFWHANGEHLPW